MTVGIQQTIWAIEKLKAGFDEAVHATGDLDAALAALGDECELTNVPVGTGATGREGIARYLAEDVLPHRPADLAFRRVTRTSDQRRVVEESVVSFTHDRELPWLLPGVAPTHRRADVLAIAVVSFRHRSWQGTTTSRIVGHRTLWDHAGLLRQLGLSATSTRNTLSST
jgi:carboxymethylenebutenolidase